MAAPTGSAEIKTSRIHPNLDREKMFGEAWWLTYCCCAGRAIGTIGDPLCGSEGRTLCLHNTCEMTSVGDPFCDGISVMCCITQQCAFPKLDGSPTCVCFNKKIAGGGTDGWKPKLFDFTPKFEDQFWLYYFLCGGVAVNGIQKDGRPILGSMRKQLCIKEAVQCVAPIQEGIFCSGLGTFLCFWNQVQFPPSTAPNNPKFACCGWKMNKFSSGSGKPAPLAYGKGIGKPAQAQMENAVA